MKNWRQFELLVLLVLFGALGRAAEPLTVPPPLEICTVEAADAALAKLPALPEPRTPRRFQTTKPFVADALLNNATRNAAIVNVREAMRELLGPFNDADNKAFEAKWNAVMEYPSPVILEWLKQVGPIATEMVRLKMLCEQNISDYNECIVGANYARDFGNHEQARALMREVGSIAATMAAAKARMQALEAKLDALGEMPDPAEQKKADAATYAEARKAVREYLCGAPPETEIDGEFELTGPFLMREWGAKNKEDVWKIMLPGVGNFNYWAQPKIFIRPILQYEENGVVAIYVYTEAFHGKVVRARQEEDGSFVIFDGLEDDIERISLKMEKDDKEDPILVMRYARPRKTSHQSFTAIYRPTNKTWYTLPGKESGKDTVERMRESQKAYAQIYGQWYDAAVKVFETVTKKAPFVDVPKAEEVYYVLSGVRPGKKGWGDAKMGYIDRGVVIDAWEAYQKVIAAMAATEQDRKKQARSATDRMGQMGLYRLDSKVRRDIYYLNSNNRRVTIDMGETETHVRWAIPTPVMEATAGVCRLPFVPQFKVKPFKHVAEPFPKNYLDVQLIAWGLNTSFKERFEQGFTGKAVATAKISELGVRPESMTVQLKIYDNYLSDGCAVDYIYTRAVLSAEEAERVSREIATNFERGIQKEWADNRFAEAAMAMDENVEKALKAEEEVAKVEAALRAAEEARQARVAFHQENIALCRQRAGELKKELDGEIKKFKDAEKRLREAKTPDEKEKIQDEMRRANERAQALQWGQICQESNAIYESDRARAEETGVFIASRTPFDTMCQVQLRESALREVQEDENLRKAQEKVYAMLARQKGEEREATERIIERIEEENIQDRARWEKLGNLLLARDVDSTVGRMEMLEDKALGYDDWITRFQRAKLFSDIGMAMTGIGGAPMVWSYVYSMGWGYIENGPMGILKGAICTYSNAVEVIWSGYDGYKTGGWKGALEGAAWSATLNTALPWIMGKVNWNKKIELKFGKKAGAPKPPKADVKAYKLEVKKAEAAVSDYVVKKNRINDLEFVKKGNGPEMVLVSRKTGAQVSDAQLTQMRMDVVHAAGKINANPTAKALLKYSKGYQKIGADFDMELGRIHKAVQAEFYKEMKARGFNDQQIQSIRNASSKGTVGMDSDWGLVEGVPITRNGRPSNKYEWMSEAQSAYNVCYKKTTGYDAEHLSWENITTSIHPEAYRNLDILSASENGTAMRNLVRNTSLSDAQQIVDVSVYKANMMLNSDKFPRLVYVREAARGAAKDMGNKFLPAIKSRISTLERMAQMATKHGKGLDPKMQRELNRLTAARDQYARIHKTLDKIGKGELPPEVWDDEIASITGGRGISDMLTDLGDVFKSLVWK